MTLVPSVRCEARCTEALSRTLIGRSRSGRMSRLGTHGLSVLGGVHHRLAGRSNHWRTR